MKLVLATVLATLIAGPTFASPSFAMSVAKNHKRIQVVRTHKPPVASQAQGTGHDRGERGDSGRASAGGGTSGSSSGRSGSSGGGAGGGNAASHDAAGGGGGGSHDLGGGGGGAGGGGGGGGGGAGGGGK